MPTNLRVATWRNSKLLDTVALAAVARDHRPYTEQTTEILRG